MKNKKINLIKKTWVSYGYVIPYIVLYAVLLMLVSSGSWVYAEGPSVHIISPQSDALWVGTNKVDVHLEGLKPDAMCTVSFYLDGRMIKEFSTPPYTFDYDFGQVPKNRKLEVVVTERKKLIARKEISSFHVDDTQVVEVLQVVVPVVVTDSRGFYVDNLKKEDFIILEDGVQQDISYFSKSGKAGFHLVLLIDISSSMKDKIQKVKDVARDFLKALMGKDDKCLIVFFNHDVFEDNDFTGELNELDNAVSLAIPFGATALYDAIAYSVKMLKSIIGHNIIILFSDGEDNSSSIDPYTLISIVERTNSVIYSIGKKTYMEGYDQYQEVLKKISVSSGGMTFFLDDVNEVQKIYDAIRKDIDAQYLLRFSPKEKEKRNRFRSITVKLKNKKGCTVRAMKGYFH
jgi:Ca-activated chloride channel homolog